MKRFGWLFVSLLGCMFLSVTLREKEHQQQQVPIENNILLHAEHLNPVFDSLMSLEKDSSVKMNVLHIGDSHIQGNYFTDKIRNLLYADFRLGSKGLVFPFQLAKTNTMVEIRSSSNQQWESRKNIQAIFAEHLGISGRAIVNITPKSSFKMYVPSTNIDYNFDEVGVLYTPINKSCELRIEDSLSRLLNRVSILKEKGFVFENFKSKTPLYKIKLEMLSPGSCVFHGLILNNSKRGGITYHVAGVNGSQFRHWAASSLLAQQAAHLKPNLIIISLGTNDANDFTLSTDDFTRYMHNLISSLKKTNPQACFILTTPPDSYYKRKYVNKHVDRIRHAILLYAEKEQIACWDLYDIMGGENSIRTWNSQGLASQDLIHFTKAGYEFQGELFYKSFIKHYNTYVTDRSK